MLTVAALLKCGSCGVVCRLVLCKIDHMFVLLLLPSGSNCAVVSKLVLLKNLTNFWL